MRDREARPITLIMLAFTGGFVAFFASHTMLPVRSLLPAFTLIAMLSACGVFSLSRWFARECVNVAHGLTMDVVLTMAIIWAQREERAFLSKVDSRLPLARWLTGHVCGAAQRWLLLRLSGCIRKRSLMGSRSTWSRPERERFLAADRVVVPVIAQRGPRTADFFADLRGTLEAGRCKPVLTVGERRFDADQRRWWGPRVKLEVYGPVPREELRVARSRPVARLRTDRAKTPMLRTVARAMCGPGDLASSRRHGTAHAVGRPHSAPCDVEPCDDASDSRGRCRSPCARELPPRPERLRMRRAQLRRWRYRARLHRSRTA